MFFENKFYMGLYDAEKQDFKKVESPQQTYSNTWNSLFLPALPPGFANEQAIAHVCETMMQLGKVKRVDIVQKENAPNRTMAFVHFHSWNHNEETQRFRHAMEQMEQVDVFGALQHVYDVSGDLYLQPIGFEYLFATQMGKNNRPFYFRFFINKTPIKETELNIHQLANMLEMAESKIEDQQGLIDGMLKELADAKERIESLEKQRDYALNHSWSEREIHTIMRPINSEDSLEIVPSPLELRRDEHVFGIEKEKDMQKMNELFFQLHNKYIKTM